MNSEFNPNYQRDTLYVWHYNGVRIIASYFYFIFVSNLINSMYEATKLKTACN